MKYSILIRIKRIVTVEITEHPIKIPTLKNPTLKGMPTQINTHF